MDKVPDYAKIAKNYAVNCYDNTWVLTYAHDSAL